MPDDPRAIARRLTTAQARAILFLATLVPDEWRSPSRDTFSSRAADCLLFSPPLIQWSPPLHGGALYYRLTALGRAVAAALWEDEDGS